MSNDSKICLKNSFILFIWFIVLVLLFQCIEAYLIAGALFVASAAPIVVIIYIIKIEYFTFNKYKETIGREE